MMTVSSKQMILNPQTAHQLCCETANEFCGNLPVPRVVMLIPGATLSVLKSIISGVAQVSKCNRLRDACYRSDFEQMDNEIRQAKRGLCLYAGSKKEICGKYFNFFVEKFDQCINRNSASLGTTSKKNNVGTQTITFDRIIGVGQLNSDKFIKIFRCKHGANEKEGSDILMTSHSLLSKLQKNSKDFHYDINTSTDRRYMFEIWDRVGRDEQYGHGSNCQQICSKGDYFSFFHGKHKLQIHYKGTQQCQ
jgi:hypothetical protein